MATFLIVFATMVIFIGLMSVGLLMGRKPIAGSCGGMSALGMEVACDVCKGDKTLCESDEMFEEADDLDLAYDATTK